jgi:hypothetical protein
VDELIPPMPPGVERKQSFFKKVFSKKSSPQPQEIPSAPPAKNMFSFDAEVAAKKEAEKTTTPVQAEPVHSDSEMIDLRSQLGLTTEGKYQAPEPKPSKEIANWDSDITEDLASRDVPVPSKIEEATKKVKTQYTATEMPLMPKLNVDATKYKSMDFTQDPVAVAKNALEEKDIPKYEVKTPVTSLDIAMLEKKKVTGRGGDWTEELKAKPAPEAVQEKKAPEPIAIVPTQLVNWTDHPDPDEQKSKSASTFDTYDDAMEKLLHSELSKKPVKHDKHHGKHGKEKKVHHHDEKFLSQPVQQFAEQFRLKMAEKIRNEERQKVMDEVEADEKAREARFDERMKKKLEAERAKLTEIINAEKERVSQERLRNQRILEDERSALKKERNALDNEKKAFETDMKKIAEREAQLAEMRVAIKKERAELEQQKIDSEEITKKLPRLRSDARMLQDRIDAIQDKIKLNQQLEDNLVRREAAIKAAQEKLEGMERQIRETGFSKYLETELSAKQIHYPTAETPIQTAAAPQPKQQETTPEIYSLIDECRALLWKNHVEEAKITYMKAREEYHSMLNHGTANEEIYTSIKELYDDISLASMK